MKTGMRILAVAVSLLMLMTGPLAPIAFAQQPPPRAARPARAAGCRAQPEPAAQQPAAAALAPARARLELARL